MKRKTSQAVIRSNTSPGIPHATVKEAVQKRILPPDHSSIIPGIDINELQHSLDLLKYALDYSEAIVDTVRLPLVVLNHKLQVLTANRAFYDTFKLTPKQTENKLIYRLNRNAWDIPRLRVLLEKILPANTNFENYEVEINFPHIGKKTMLLNARRTYRQVNNTEAILLAFEDISDRKHIENQKDNFIGIVSHELKTPLTSIKVFSELLERHLNQKSDKRGSYFLAKMSNQMERLTQLMASFVNVYQIQNGTLRLTKQAFDIDKMVSSVISDFQYNTNSHAVVYDSSPGLVTYGDKARIAQVLVNLISNAIKYSPSGERVIVRSEKNSKNAIISVQDFGIGMNKENMEKIFDRFYRIENKERKSISGLGLGLYISKEIIDRHKGRMWAESKKGKGSTFYVSLPAKN